MSALELHVGADGDHVIVVAAEGELDLETASLLTESVDAALSGGAERVVLDLREVSFIDSSGLLALEVAQRSAAASGARVVLRSVSRRTQDLFALTGLESVFTIER